jgi:rhodanese-related sulfurtransferase
MTLRRHTHASLLALLTALPLLAAGAACNDAQTEQAQTEARAEDGPSARERVAAGEATLLDVRTPGEFASGHVDGALNIPVQELAQRMSELPRDKGVVVYCHSGGRSAAAADMLRQAGYEVEDVGAMPNW